MTAPSPHIAVIHGPNINMLGLREPEVYGRETLDDVNAALHADAATMGIALTCFQSNSEGEIIDQVQNLRGKAYGLIINPGGLTHTSVSLRDAISAADVPAIEVHISNIHAREPFRATSYISGIAKGVICGLGTYGYRLALQTFKNTL